MKLWTCNLRELDPKRVQTGKSRWELFEPSVFPPTKHTNFLHTKVANALGDQPSPLNLPLPSRSKKTQKNRRFTTDTSQSQPAHKGEELEPEYFPFFPPLVGRERKGEIYRFSVFPHGGTRTRRSPVFPVSSSREGQTLKDFPLPGGRRLKNV